MLVSRGLNVLKASKLLKSGSGQSLQQVRNSHTPWNYRVAGPPPAKGNIIAAEIVQGFGWWWILWHLWTEPGHVFGEFEYPDPRKWTDEELGIPQIE